MTPLRVALAWITAFIIGWLAFPVVLFLVSFLIGDWL